MVNSEQPPCALSFAFFSCIRIQIAELISSCFLAHSHSPNPDRWAGGGLPVILDRLHSEGFLLLPGPLDGTEASQSFLQPDGQTPKRVLCNQRSLALLPCGSVSKPTSHKQDSKHLLAFLSLSLSAFTLPIWYSEEPCVSKTCHFHFFQEIPL